MRLTNGLLRSVALIASLALAAPAQAQFGGGLFKASTGGGGGSTAPTVKLVCGDWAISFFGTSQTTGGIQGNGSGCPTNTIAVGDWIGIVYGILDNSNIGTHSPTCPTGFTTPTIASVSNPLQDAPTFVKSSIALVCWKKAVTADTAGGGGTLAYTANWTTANTDGSSWMLLVLTGQDPTTPLNVIANKTNDDGSGSYTTTQTAPSVTPTFAATLLVCDYVLARGDSGSTTDPAGMSLLFNGDDDVNFSFKAFYQTLSSTAATGIKTLIVPAGVTGGSAGIGMCLAVKGV